jgi:hypothetical protein
MEKFPLIPPEHLLASCVCIRGADVLLHKKRFPADASAAALACQDCKESLTAKPARMPKFALANGLWLGREIDLLRSESDNGDPLLAHQLLLALGRVVTVKIVSGAQMMMCTALQARSSDVIFKVQA